MKTFSKQIHYFYTAFTKIKHRAWHGDMTITLKKTLSPFQDPDLVYIGCSVGCKPLLESCRELKFAWKSRGFCHGQGCGSTGGTPGSLVQAAAEQEPAQQRTSGLLPKLHPKLPALCPAHRAQPPHPSVTSRLWSSSSSDQPSSHGNCSCISHTAFQGFPRGAQ